MLLSTLNFFSEIIGIMTTTFLQVCVLAVLAATFGKTSGGQQCSIDQYINKNGKCRYCKFCRTGEGMNFTTEVL